MIEICQKCGTFFEMGDNGTVNGCDKCTGIERDSNGYWWKPKDRVHFYQSIKTGEVFAVKRLDAFKDKRRAK